MFQVHVPTISLKFNSLTTSILTSLFNLAQFIFSIVWVTAVSQQAQYGAERSCLLYISNYVRVGRTFEFNADSGVCTATTVVGSIHAIVSFICFAYTCYAFYTDLKPLALKRRVSLLFFGIMLWFTVFVMACLGSDGLHKTCMFMEEGADADCGNTFNSGFVENGSIEYKVLGVVQTGLAFAWGLAVLDLFWVVSFVVQFKRKVNK